MEYHEDRFEDFSLLVYKKNKLVAVLPANTSNNSIYSHQGLTYGGLILSNTIKFDSVVLILKKLLEFISNNGFDNLIIKQIPTIYNSLFTQETQYLMFVLDAILIKRDTLSVIDLNNKLKTSNNRLEGFKRGEKHKLVIKEDDDFELFWNTILTKNLKEKHDAKPVHSLEEIRLLKKRFPNNIRQFNVYKDNEIVAGTTLFVSKHVVHSQYISGNPDKNELGSLDFLHLHLINEIFKHKKYFDFGTSNINNGLQINKGLQFWKEGFGARTVIQDFYEVSTSCYVELDKVMV